ncbi:MAG: LTA synthase family protein [Oscillospiraceae bacterium]|nr:LTA synthase family protein [Oscillospiraceae bacterium]
MTKTRSRRPLHPVTVAGLTLLLAVAYGCFFAARWFVTVYGRIGFDSILFTLQSSLDGVQSDLVQSYLLRGALPAAVCTVLSCVVLLMLRRLPLRRWVSVVTSVALAVGLLGYAAVDVELTDYIWQTFTRSGLYESDYVDPDSVEITFPEQKRNLVYIMLESMETTYLSEELKGGSDVNLIPELTALAQEGINFSHNDTVGGFHSTNGASWTIGAIVAQTAGIPLKTPAGIDDWQNGYGKDGIFLPGVTSINDILDEAGYYTSFLCGSDANFGGRKTYYTTHGTDEIFDIYTARRDGIVPQDYFEWWGMEDLNLFAYAKQELTEISQGDEPFAFSMLTVDTHHIGGYQCACCRGEFEEPYEQSIACSSRQVLEFVDWLKAQPFWDNTTVVITGDHLSMDNGYFERNVAKGYDRMVYNCILNSPVTSDNTQNRDYCAVDLFPTTLAALGCTIEGDRLGLGTNLFSNRPTLAEKLGFDRFNNELGQASDYYVENFHTVPEA